MIRTRFAPSPTGPLHLGHAYSAGIAWKLAKKHNGQFLVRIEDLDQSRARQEWDAQIFQDLSWLGFVHQGDVMRQSERFETYKSVLNTLNGMGVLYPCTCTRRDIQNALSAPQEVITPLLGPDGPIYPGTCSAKAWNGSSLNSALRLNMKKAIEVLNKDQLSYQEIGPSGRNNEKVVIAAKNLVTAVGDVVVARRNMAAAYHLAVVVDDHTQQVTHVVRGKDLADATAIHLVLQNLLGFKTPTYFHHNLIRDENGKRLAKRDDAKSIAKYRNDGLTAKDILAKVNL